MEREFDDSICSNEKDGVIGSIDILSGEKSVVELTGQVHQLPCCIKQDGPCSVSHYFKPKKTGIETEGLSVEESCFRGRKLQGATIPLPEGYQGFVLGKKQKPGKRKTSGNSEENSNCWEKRAEFQNLTYWNHDTLPSHDDVLLRCFHWFPVANAIIKACIELYRVASQSLHFPTAPPSVLYSLVTNQLHRPVSLQKIWPLHLLFQSEVDESQRKYDLWIE